MVTLQIGNDSREIRTKSDIDETWINQQINRRRAEGQKVCVRVTIDEGNVRLLLATPGCGTGIGSPRPLNSSERDLFELWSGRGLDRIDFTGGSVIAFLRQMPQL
jgi:hypothetical protein